LKKSADAYAAGDYGSAEGLYDKALESYDDALDLIG
jgi:hypothetical protein